MEITNSMTQQIKMEAPLARWHSASVWEGILCIWYGICIVSTIYCERNDACPRCM